MQANKSDFQLISFEGTFSGSGKATLVHPIYSEHPSTERIVLSENPFGELSAIKDRVKDRVDLMFESILKDLLELTMLALSEQDIHDRKNKTRGDSIRRKKQFGHDSPAYQHLSTMGKCLPVGFHRLNSTNSWYSDQVITIGDVMSDQCPNTLGKYETQLTHNQSAAERRDVLRIAHLVNRLCEIHSYTYQELAEAIGVDKEAISIVTCGVGSSHFARLLLDQIRQHIGLLSDREQSVIVDPRDIRKEETSIVN